MLGRGAGGGRIWMEEGEIKEQPTDSRVREAVAFDGAESIVLACGKDVTVFRDGAKKHRARRADLVEEDLIALVHAAT